MENPGHRLAVLLCAHLPPNAGRHRSNERSPQKLPKLPKWPTLLLRIVCVRVLQRLVYIGASSTEGCYRPNVGALFVVPGVIHTGIRTIQVSLNTDLTTSGVKVLYFRNTFGVELSYEVATTVIGEICCYLLRFEQLVSLYSTFNV